MGKPFLRTKFTENDTSEIISKTVNLEQVVYFIADRGEHLTAVRLRDPAKLREKYGPRPPGDLLYFAIERALKNGATMWVTRLLYLSDPTDIATIDALASEVTLDDQAGTPAEFGDFFVNELGVAGDNFSIVTEAGTTANTFKITLSCSETGVGDEAYDNLSVDPASDDYFITKLANGGGRLRGTDTTPAATPTYPDDLPEFGSFDLAGGSNGTALDAASIIGDSAAGTGFHAAGAALTSSNVMAAHQELSSDPAVIAAGLAYADLNGGADIAMFQSPPDHADGDDAIAFRNGTTPYSHTPFDSSFGVLSYGSHQVFDVTQGSNQYLPLVGELAPMLVRAFDRNRGGAFWLAPAGPKRGKVSSDVTGLSDDLGIPTRVFEADALCDANYNPFVTRSGSIRYWGNQTLLLDETSVLVNLHVRFLMIGLRRILKVAFDKTSFEPQDPVNSWLPLYLRVNPILERLRDTDRAFNNFKYRGDQFATRVDDQEQLEVNDVADLALGKYKVIITIQPFSAIDYEINVVMEVTSTAVRFEELFADAA